MAAGSPTLSQEQAQSSRAIAQAEAATLADPRNAEQRIALGDTYLDAGRFGSAETAFNDAMALGNNSARAALSLALTQIAQAKYPQAAALLNDWDGEIAKADLGLALSLAGQPERGIHIMSNAIRGGENTIKMRQNLAYAFAMAGRWREARLMAQQDLPASEVNNRIEQWAAMSSAGAYQRRIANLLQVPVGVADSGQPVQLALSNSPATQQFARADQPNAAPAPIGAELAPLAPTAVSQAPVAQAPIAAPLAISATPQRVAMSAPVEQVEIPASVSTAATLAMPAPSEPSLAASQTAPAPQPENFIAAFSAPATSQPVTMAKAASAPHTLQYVSNPVVQAIPAAVARANAAPVERATPLAVSQQPTPPLVHSDGSHLVQLGSFSSEAGARRAWDIYVGRFPELASHDRVITQAIVRGKRYWRVSAGGYSTAGSQAMCGKVRSSSGDGCISWAAATPLPGSVESGVMLARR